MLIILSLSFTKHGFLIRPVMLCLLSHPKQVWSSISLGTPLGMVWRRHILSLPTQFLQSSKQGPAGSHCPCFPAQIQLELSCSVQATQSILHQTRIQDLCLPLLLCAGALRYLSTCRRRARKEKKKTKNGERCFLTVISLFGTLSWAADQEPRLQNISASQGQWGLGLLYVGLLWRCSQNTMSVSK